MAGRIGLCCLFVLALALGGVGCGVKSMPIPSTEAAPQRVRDLRAQPTPDGVEVSFSVPREEKPSRRVVQVRLYYGTMPLTGDPDCPPCPPRLRRYKAFDLTGPAARLMEGGVFRYLDDSVPLGRLALYQVVLVDARGRPSRPSPLVRAPWVAPAPPPTGLVAIPGDGKVSLAWDAEPPAKPTGDQVQVPAGYFVYRLDPDTPAGRYRQLNSRPLTRPSLVDKTVHNGKTYAYRVARVMRVVGIPVPGRPTAWIKVVPQDQTAPRPPSDLNAASEKDGIYLRFTPSPDQDTKGYLVYRQGPGDKDFVQLTPQPVSENTFVDRSAQPRQVYRYQVVAVDESGNTSPPSEVLEVLHIP